MERTGISICECEIDVFQNSSSLMQGGNSAIAFQRSHYLLSFSGAPLNILSTLTKCSTFYNSTTFCIWRDVLVTNLFQPYISVSLLQSRKAETGQLTPGQLPSRKLPPRQLLPRTISHRTIPHWTFPTQDNCPRTITSRIIPTQENCLPIIVPGQFPLFW